jgi:hypothetical protein
MFRVVVDPESFTETAAGAVTGKLHVEFDGVCFPDDGWWDFPLVVLGWWLDALGSDQDFELRFMDGPYRVAGSRTGGDVRLRLLRSGSSGDVEVAAGTADASTVLAEIEAAATRAVAYCSQASLPTEGIERLLGSGS